MSPLHGWERAAELPELDTGDSPGERAGPRGRRARLVDVSMCALALVLGLVCLSTGPSGDAIAFTGVRAVLELGCGAAACVLLWWRRRWPIGVALGCLLLGTVSVS